MEVPMKPRLKLSVLTFKQYFNNENNIFSLNVVSHQENNKNETSTESIGENNTKSSFERDNKTLFEAGLSEDNKTMFQNGIQSYSNRNELKNDQCEGGSDETNEENTINKSGCSGESQESYRFKMNDRNQTVNWNSKNKIQYNLSNLIYGGQNEGSRRGYNIRDDEGSRLLNSGPNKDHFVRFQRDQISNRHGNQQSFSNQKNEHQTEFVRPGDNENTKNKGQFESKHSCSRDTRGFQRDGRNQIGKFRGNQDNKNPCGANNFRGDQHNQNPGGASNFRGNQHNKNPGGANNVRASQHNQNHGGANNFRGNQKYQHFSRENVEKQGNFHHGNSDYRSDQDQPRPYQNGYQFRKGTSFTKPNFIYQECRPTSVQSDYQDYSNMERPNSSQSDYLVGQRNVQFNKLNSRSNQASREDLSQNPNQRMNRNPHGFNRGHYNNFGNNRGFNRPNSSYNHSQNHVPNRGNFHGHSRGSGSVNQFNPRFNSSVVNDCNPPGTANTGRQEDQSRLRSRRGAKILIFDSRKKTTDGGNNEDTKLVTEELPQDETTGVTQSEPEVDNIEEIYSDSEEEDEGSCVGKDNPFHVMAVDFMDGFPLEEEEAIRRNIDLDEEVKELLLFGKEEDVIITKEPKTLRDMMVFMQKYPNATAVTIKD